jgi:hypothetical protein
MPKILNRWTVMPHGPLEEIDEGILTVAGEIVMPLGRFPRRMTVIGLIGERTIIWSAIALAEPEMARIEALGRPSFLIVPSDAHRLDARIWKQRYPDIQVVTTSGARAGVSEAVPVDTTEAGWTDPAVHFQTVPGTGGHEGALTVRRSDGVTLIVNDVIGHVRHPNGLGAHLMARLMGFGVSGPRVPWPVRRKIVRDPGALGQQFRKWADDPALKRIIVSHGDPIEKNPAGTLRALAGHLGD